MLHLDQVIRLLQHPRAISAMSASGMEVEFRTGKEEGLTIRGVQHINGRICVDLRPAEPPTEAPDKTA